jgi:hypothetical protein
MLQRNEFSHTMIHGSPAPGKLLVAHKPAQGGDASKDAAVGAQASKVPPAGALLPARPQPSVGKQTHRCRENWVQENCPYYIVHTPGSLWIYPNI